MKRKRMAAIRGMRLPLLLVMLLFAALAKGQSWTAQPVGEGDFYIQNVENQKFLSIGCNWAIRATYDLQGLCWKLTRVSDNTYRLYQDSDRPGYLKNTGINEFYVNGNESDIINWTFEPVAGRENTYTIKDSNGRILRPSGGDEYFSSNSSLSEDPKEKYYFTLVSKAEREDLSKATQNNPSDMTYKIYNQSMNYYGGEFTIGNHWQLAENSATPGRGGQGNVCSEVWNNVFNMYQTLNDMPNGQYTVRMQGFYRVGDDVNNPSKAAEARNAGNEVINAYLYANDQSKQIASIFASEATTYDPNKHDGTGYTIDGTTYYVPTNMVLSSRCFSDGEFENSITTEVTNGTLTFGLKKEVPNSMDWTIFDNFRLLYAPSFTELDQLVANAKAKPDKPTALVSLIADIEALDRPNTTKAMIDSYVEQLTQWTNVYTEGYVYTFVDGERKFFSRGADWNTRLILADYGYPVLITTSEAKNGTIIKCLDSQQMMKSDGETTVYTDGNEGNKVSMKVSPGPDGGFYIQCNNDKSQDGYFGPRDAERPLVIAENLSQEQAYVWHVMPSADYNKYVAERQLAEAKGKALTAAGITEADLNYWTSTTIKDASATETTELKQYYGERSVSKKWDYDGLEKGLYRISLQAFFRSGDANAQFAQAKAGYDSRLAFLKVNDQALLLHSIMDGKSTTDMGNSVNTTLDGTTYYVPNWLDGVQQVMNSTDNYLNQMLVYVGDEGKLSIELSAVSHISWEWLPYKDLVIEKLQQPSIAEGAQWTKPSEYVTFDGAFDPGFVYEEIGGHTHGEYACNTWSWEQNSDQSGLVLPFFQDWTTDDAELGNATLTKTMTGMPEGYYDISARVRVYDLNSADGKTYNAEAGAKGLSMIANDASVAITTGKQITEGTNAGKGFYGDYHIVGHVTADGLLKVGFKLDGADFSWLAFDDLKVAFIGQNDSYTSTTDGVTTLCGNAAFDAATIVTTEIRTLDVTRLAHHNAMQIATEASPNVLIKANVGQVGNDHNVIVDGTCDNLVLTDKQPFAVVEDFTATNVNYERGTITGFSTLYLPFSFQTDGLEVLKLQDFNDGIITFETVSTTEPYTPYLVRPLEGESEANVSFTLNNQTIGTTAELEDVTANGIAFKGVLSTNYINGNDGCYAYSATDHLFKKCSATANGGQGTKITAFRAYLQIENPNLAPAFIDFGEIYNGETGIEAPSNMIKGENVFYDLSGRRVNKPQKGIYVMGARKVVIK